MSKVYFNHTSKVSVTKLKLAPPCTIAIQKKGDHFEYGIAICSDRDNFCKKKGREIAQARLEGSFGKISLTPELTRLSEAEACKKLLFSLTVSTMVRYRHWRKKLGKYNRLIQEEMYRNPSRIEEATKSSECPTSTYSEYHPLVHHRF